MLTTSDGFAKDVRVIPIVVAELELGDVERQILRTDLMERADKAALKDRPEAFDCVGVNRADNVLAVSVSDGAHAARACSATLAMTIEA